MLIGQTVFENLVVRQIFWLPTQCGSGLHLGHKINFFLQYFCQVKNGSTFADMLLWFMSSSGVQN